MTTVAEVDPTARLKLGAGMVRLRVRVFVTPPPVAVTTGWLLPEAALEAAVSVSVLLPLPGDAMLAGEKAAVTPFGSPLTESAIAELKFWTAVVNVNVAVLPTIRLPLDEFAVKVKLGTSTVRLRV